jgi:putative dimethyl sulfoxide reductase chaperone
MSAPAVQGAPASETLTVAADSPAAARSEVYALFAQVLRFPQGELGDALASGEAYQALAQAAGTLPYRYTFMAPPLRDARALGRVYTALFDSVAGKPRVALLEQRHAGAPSEHELWEELLRFYRYFGLDFSTGAARERPDHLLVELEFMHYLTFLEAGAGDGHEGLRRGQQDFLSRHLARWLPGLAAALAESDDTAPYDALVHAVLRFVGADATYIGAPLAGPQPPGRED